MAYTTFFAKTDKIFACAIVVSSAVSEDRILGSGNDEKLSGYV